MMKAHAFSLSLALPKNHCCGCGACAALCPVEAITMEPDKEGFLYPAINEAKCVACMTCERACAFKVSLSSSLS